MKKFIKKFLPFLIPLFLIYEFFIDYYRYIKFTGVLNQKTNKEKLIAKIIAEYHVVEKGLTMPNIRLGFGKDNLLSLIDNCNYFKDKFGFDEQLWQAINVINEYDHFHKINKYKIDNLLQLRIEELKKYNSGLNNCSQKEVHKTEYFQYSKYPFNEFSNSRKSIRTYTSEEIPLETIENAIKVATNAPSSCNRQGNRVYVLKHKDLISQVLKIQGGNRGFGHQTNTLLIVTADLAISHGVYEKNQIYVDGGMFCMNLLYALHFDNIATCPLNCNFSVPKNKRLRKLLKISESENFILMISCGYPPDKFQHTLSKRYSINHTLKYVYN